MRRVRRDVKPCLPKPSSSTKAAPSLFRGGSSSRRDDEDKDEEKKKLLARNLTTPVHHHHHRSVAYGKREVGIQHLAPGENDDDDDDDDVVVDVAVNSRNSVDEIRRQRGLRRRATIVKAIVALSLIYLAATTVLRRAELGANADDAENHAREEATTKTTKNIAADETTTTTKTMTTDKKFLVDKLMSETVSEWDEKDDERDEKRSEPSDRTKDDEDGAGAASAESSDSETSDQRPQLSGGGGLRASVTMSEIPETLPEAFDHFVDLSVVFDAERHVPFFWDVHLGGGTVVEHALGKCLRFVQASEMGVILSRTSNGTIDHHGDDALRIVEVSGEKYLNVDTTTVEGLERARSLDVFRSDDPPAVVHGPLLREAAATLFADGNGNGDDDGHRGRLFALFRHPVRRAVNMYHYLRDGATWDRSYDPRLRNATIVEYARSGSIDNNWLTRFLVDKRGGRLSADDLALAKEILRRKCLVGLFEETQNSFERFERFFRWTVSKKERKCLKQVFKNGDLRHRHEPVDEGTEEWDAILAHNKYDMELYEFAKTLYKKQGKVFETRKI